MLRAFYGELKKTWIIDYQVRGLLWRMNGPYPWSQPWTWSLNAENRARCLLWRIHGMLIEIGAYYWESLGLDLDLDMDLDLDIDLDHNHNHDYYHDHDPDNEHGNSRSWSRSSWRHSLQWVPFSINRPFIIHNKHLATWSTFNFFLIR